MTKHKSSSKRGRHEKEQEEIQSLTISRHRKKSARPRPRTAWNSTLVFRGPVTLDLFTSHRPFGVDSFIEQLLDISRLRQFKATELPKKLPLLPPVLRSLAKRKTLVLDIDETLVHSDLNPDDVTGFDHVFEVVTHLDERKVVGLRKRPYVEDFLQWCGEHFELVTFTSSIKEYADQVIDYLDPTKEAVKYRLYRESCTFFSPEYYLKDLEHLRRDLNGVLLVDNSPIAFALQMDNGIPIESFIGAEQKNEDIELLKLKNFLESLLSVDDVRPHIREKFKLEDVIEHLKKMHQHESL